MMNNREFDRVLYFLELVSDVTLNFREQVQQALKQVWGYQHSVFWFTKDDGETFNPQLLGISDHIISEYFDFYIVHDFLHPTRYIHENSDIPSVLASYHILSLDELKRSVYYQEFMRKHCYIDEMAVNFSYNNKIIATLGILKQQGELPFNEQDVWRFQSISKIIEKKMMHYFTIKEMIDEKQLIRNKLAIAEDGYILLDTACNVLYGNPVAQQILQQQGIKAWLPTQIHNERFIWSSDGQQYVFSTTKRDHKFDGFYTTPTYLLRVQANNRYINNLQRLGLTSREEEVCALLLEGLSYAEMSTTLFITVNTIKHHVKNIYQKAKVTKVGELRRLLFV